MSLGFSEAAFVDALDLGGDEEGELYGKDETVKVVVRVRPLNELELTKSSDVAVTATGPKSIQVEVSR